MKFAKHKKIKHNFSNIKIHFRASGGELQALLDDDMALTESQTRTCMREVLKALQHLHKRRIAHLDLKPQNILLAGNNVEGKTSNHHSALAPLSSA